MSISPTAAAKVLLVDDDPAMCEMLEARLGKRGYEVSVFTAPQAALTRLTEAHFDVLVSDVNMKGMDGVELCRRALEVRADLPVVLITAFGTMETAIAAIRAGAYDFIPKPFEIDQLVLALERAIGHARLKEEVRRLKRAVADTQRVGNLVGQSPKMKELFVLLGKIAPTDATVFISGESGTGKELVARAIHDGSSRAQGPFVAVNCAAMPEALLESELFGHVKGAFTDARTAKTGLFAAANGGTLFLDEVGELPLGLQPKLLRALQEKLIRPIGGTVEVRCDARIVTASNRDLEAMVEEKRFREDLFFRINVIQLDLPPLRARTGDVLLLAQHFLEKIGARHNKPVRSYASEAAEKLMAYPWPGNVRELENSVERAVALASYDVIAVGDLPEKVRAHKATLLALGGEDPAELVSLEEMEKRYVLRVLEATTGNKAAAARTLRIERKTLYRMLERWGQSPPAASGGGTGDSSSGA